MENPDTHVEKVLEEALEEAAPEEAPRKRPKVFEMLFGKPQKSFNERLFGGSAKRITATPFNLYKCFQVLLESDVKKPLLQIDLEVLKFRIMGKIQLCQSELGIPSANQESEKRHLKTLYSHYREKTRLNLQEWSEYSHGSQFHHTNMNRWASSFPKWSLLLKAKSSILIGGIGNKNGVLSCFHLFHQSNAKIAASGYQPQAIQGILSDLEKLEKVHFKHGDTDEQRWSRLRDRFDSENPRDTCLFISNIDGPAFQNRQAFLSSLAEFFPIVATVDNEGMCLMWDFQMIERFQWWNTVVHTYEPYENLDTGARGMLLVEFRRFQRLQNLLWKAPSNARKCFSVLCGMVLQRGLVRGRQNGISLTEWDKEAGSVKNAWIRDWVQWGALQSKSENVFVIPLDIEEIVKLESWLNEDDIAPQIRPVDDSFVESVLAFQKIGFVSISQSNVTGKITLNKQGGFE
jgi:hypothetical protein